MLNSPNTALFVSPSLDHFLTEDHDLENDPADIQFRGKWYRRLDPLFYLWIRQKVDQLRIANGLGKVNDDLYKTFRERWSVIHEFAISNFNREGLRKLATEWSIGKHNNYTPPGGNSRARGAVVFPQEEGWDSNVSSSSVPCYPGPSEMPAPPNLTPAAKREVSAIDRKWKFLAELINSETAGLETMNSFIIPEEPPIIPLAITVPNPHFFAKMLLYDGEYGYGRQWPENNLTARAAVLEQFLLGVAGQLEKKDKKLAEQARKVLKEIREMATKSNSTVATAPLAVEEARAAGASTAGGEGNVSNVTSLVRVESECAAVKNHAGITLASAETGQVENLAGSVVESEGEAIVGALAMVEKVERETVEQGSLF